MLWDGFDKPLGHGKHSNQLWDQMRAIFDGKLHKIVLVTRGPLTQRIRDYGISDFWNLFYMNSVRIEPFDEQDQELILGELPGITFQQGAKSELSNWSSGYPPIYLELLNKVNDEMPNGTIDNVVVNRAALNTSESLRELMKILWADCTASAKDVYMHLVSRGDLLITDVGKDEQLCLIEKGFAKQSGNKLLASCRMLQQYVKDVGPDAGSLTRLFGTWEDYKLNIRSLLEHRLAQMPRFDDRLCRLVARAIEDVPEHPDDCLNNLTHIEDQALDLIWQHEFGAAKIIPQAIVSYWKQAGPTDKIVQRLSMPGQTDIVVPTDRSLQCGILQLLTGSKQGFNIRAKSASKDTYVLINALHSFRNRGQHSDGQVLNLGVAVAAIMTCLELLACLSLELTS